MAHPLIIKEGPFVFLRNVLIMEIVAFVAFFIISFLENYELLYQNIGLDTYIRYDLFVIFAFSIFQLVYMTLLFLNWYFSHYEIHEKEIIRKSGLLFRRKKSVRLSDIVSVEIYQSPFSRPIHHATIILEHQNGRVTKLRNISNFNEHIYLIKQQISNFQNIEPAKDITLLLKSGENHSLEFKETLRYDIKTKSASRELERAVMKTIVGFLNGRGGLLIIGVDDEGKPCGLERDFNSLPKKNRDGFENHLNMLVKTMIGLPFAKHVNVTFEKVDNKILCLVTVKAGHKPAYLNGNDKKEEFYVRVGNSTQPFSMSEAEDYIKTRWS